MRKYMKNTCCWEFVNAKPGKLIKFFILLLLDLVDVAIDWYFFTRVTLIKPGLVYGPLHSTYRWTIFVFCMIGSITLILETLTNIDDLNKQKKFPCLTQSFTNFLNIICEDIPLLTINLILALCHDGDVSFISFIKASIGICAVAIRLILMILVYWIFEKKKSRFEFVCDICSTFGLIIVAALSVSIHLLNTFPVDKSGFFIMENPENFNRAHFITEKYLNNAGVYAKWPINDVDSHHTDHIWMADVNDILQSERLSVKIRTSIDTTQMNETVLREGYDFCIIKSDKSDCYTVNTNKTISLNVNVTALKFGFDVLFESKPPIEYQYLAGYIDFAINQIQIDATTSAKTCTPISIKPFIYAKYSFGKLANSTYLKFYDGIDKYGFYNGRFDLETADKIWKTGFIGCDSSGDRGPKLSTNIKLSC